MVRSVPGPDVSEPPVLLGGNGSRACQHRCLEDPRAVATQRPDLRPTRRPRHQLAQLLHRPPLDGVVQVAGRQQPRQAREHRPVLRRRGRRHAPRLLAGRPGFRQRRVRGERSRHPARRVVRVARRQRGDARCCVVEVAADLAVRRARRLLRPRPATARDQAGRHPARHPRATRPAGRLRPVRFPRAGGHRVAVRAAQLRLARGSRPHVGPQARRDEMESPRAHVPRCERRQPANADNLLDSLDFDHQAFRDPPRLPEPGRTSHPSTCTPGEPGPIPPPN